MRGTDAQSRGSYMAQVIADLKRDSPTVKDDHELVEAIETRPPPFPRDVASSSGYP